ncbi:MAG: two-component system phosphate regulon sensor histidine kinase PhoR [Litorivivens sp.]|jgi:two-component system phosphate regulon sensor histidine kinase PhoR
MTRNHVTLIVLLMTVSLFGIGGLQWYWLDSAYSEREAEFDRSVAQALTSSVNELERKQAEFYFDQNLSNEFIPELTVLLREHRIVDWLEHDEEEGILVIQPSANGDEQSTTEIILWTGDSTDEVEHEVQIVTEPHTSTQDSYSITRFESADTSFSDTVIFRRQIEHKINVVEDVLGQMIVAELTSSNPVEARLQVCDIDSLVKTNLQGQGVTTAFELHLPDTLGTSKKRAPTEYSTSLFPGTEFSQEHTLGISFPDKDTYVLSSMATTFMLVIGFTLIMLFTFAFTVYYIIRQKKISEMKTDFINNMTHEFKTPLATISLAADSIRHPEVSGDMERVDYYLDIIHDENKRLSAHVENVLQIARMEKEELKLNIGSVDLNELVQRVAASMELQVREKSGSIKTALEASSISVDGDQSHLYNAILNLVDNAIKYCKQAPMVSLSTHREGNEVLLEVVDNGIGMSKEVQSRIFKTFYRAQQGNLHEVKGFGLGLSYVKTIVDKHSGAIEVESTLGQGTRIRITLPLK